MRFRSPSEDAAPIENCFHSVWSAPGRRATMFTVMISDAPLPMPCSVIISPSHITSIAPAVSVMIVITVKPRPGCRTTESPFRPIEVGFAITAEYI